MHGLEHVARGPLARRPPEEALVGAALVIAALLASATALAPTVVLAGAATVLMTHGVPVTRTLAWLAAPAGLLAVGLLPTVLSCDLTPLGCHVDAAAVPTTGRTILRGLAVASVAAMLVSTTRVGALLTGLRRLHVPEELVDLLGTTWSLAIVGQREVRTLRTAAALRQGDRSIAAQWRTVCHLLPTIAQRVLRRAARRADFAALRGGRDLTAPRQQPSPTIVGLLAACLPGAVVWGLGR